jgi:hypothetical protein
MVQACSSAAVQQFAGVRPMWKSQACSKAESGGICRGLANKWWQAGQKLANSESDQTNPWDKVCLGFPQDLLWKKKKRQPGACCDLLQHFGIDRRPGCIPALCTIWDLAKGYLCHLDSSFWRYFP